VFLDEDLDLEVFAPQPGLLPPSAVADGQRRCSPMGLCNPFPTVPFLPDRQMTLLQGDRCSRGSRRVVVVTSKNRTEV